MPVCTPRGARIHRNRVRMARTTVVSSRPKSKSAETQKQVTCCLWPRQSPRASPPTARPCERAPSPSRVKVRVSIRKRAKRAKSRRGACDGGGNSDDEDRGRGLRLPLSVMDNRVNSKQCICAEKTFQVYVSLTSVDGGGLHAAVVASRHARMSRFRVRCAGGARRGKGHARSRGATRPDRRLFRERYQPRRRAKRPPPRIRARAFFASSSPPPPLPQPVVHLRVRQGTWRAAIGVRRL